MKQYSAKLKSKILQEVKEIGNVPTVAKKHNIPVSTVHTWISRESKNQKASRAKTSQQSKLRALEKRVKEYELEVKVLRDLLKKTNHAWLGE